MEGDIAAHFYFCFVLTFQSTPSAWRETSKSICFRDTNSTFQSTPSAWRETRRFLAGRCDSVIFQSTPSAWRETAFQKFICLDHHISIHSLRMEGDFQHVTQLRQYRIFQSTPSAWRETIPSASAWRTASISIHSLRMEGDHYLAFMILLTKYFNPLPPHGGRLYAQVVTWYIL